ncbi:MAG: hypothetical protein ACK4NF_00360 [Planctomycetota bacterium]
MIISWEDFRNLKGYSLIGWSVFLGSRKIGVIILITFLIACKTNRTTLPLKVDGKIPQTEGLEIVLRENDGDIIEFDVSSDSNLLVYSTNAYRSVFQVFLMNFKENKKQYLLPENVEQHSPTLVDSNVYFVRIDKGISHITCYDIKNNTTKTIFQINNLVLKLASDKMSSNLDRLGFAVKDKGLWRIWVFDNNKFIFIDDGFAPFLAGDYIYFQKPNLKGENFYSIYAYDLSNRAKYSIISDTNKSYINPSVSKNTSFISFVEFSNSNYFLKLMDLKTRRVYTLFESSTPILSPNLNVEGYIYFLWRDNGQFAVYRKRI